MAENYAHYYYPSILLLKSPMKTGIKNVVNNIYFISSLRPETKEAVNPVSIDFIITYIRYSMHNVTV